MNQRSTVFFSLVLVTCVWLAALITPFIVFPWVLFPFLFAKTLVFQTLVELGLVPFVVLISGSREWRAKAQQAVRSIIGLALIGFIIATLLATFFGVDRDVSWWGTEERGGGVFTLLHIAAFFFMAKTVYPAPLRARRLIRAMVIAGVLLSGIALLRLKGVLIFGVDLGYRFSGTIGNPVFFALLLIFEITFAAYLAFTAARVRSKALWWTITFFQTIILFSTQTRGALIGLILALGVFAAFEMWYAPRRARRIAVGVATLCIGLGVVAYFLRDTTIIKRIPIVHRLAHTTTSETTARTRLIAWKIAFDAWKEKPLFGWGPENFSIAFNRHYNPRLLEYSYGETWFDKPHNVLLEMLTTRGLIGALTYLALYGAYVVALRRRLKGGHETRVLLAGAAGYLGAGLTAFDTPTSLMFFMVLLMVGEDRSTRVIPGGAVGRGVPLFAGITSALGAALLIWRFNVIPLQASNALLHTLIVAVDRTVEESIPRFAQALSFPTPYKEEARNDFAKQAVQLLEAGKIPVEDLHRFVQIVTEEYVYNVEEHPAHAYYPFMMGRIFTEASRYDAGYRTRAEEHLTRALALSPRRQQFSFALAKLKFDHGDYEGAREIYRAAIQDAPRVGEAHWFLAIVSRKLGDHEGAEREFLEAAHLLYATHSRDESLLLYYAAKNTGAWEIASTYLERALSFEESAALYAELALVYRELGQWENVKKAAHNAARVDPSYEREAEAFITSLPD